MEGQREVRSSVDRCIRLTKQLNYTLQLTCKTQDSQLRKQLVCLENVHFQLTFQELLYICWLLWFWCQDTIIFHLMTDFCVRRCDSHFFQKPVKQIDYSAHYLSSALSLCACVHACLHVCMCVGDLFWVLSSRSSAIWGSFFFKVWNMDQDLMKPIKCFTEIEEIIRMSSILLQDIDVIWHQDLSARRVCWDLIRYRKCLCCGYLSLSGKGMAE